MILQVETFRRPSPVEGDPDVTGLRFAFRCAQVTPEETVFMWTDDDGFKQTMPVWR